MESLFNRLHINEDIMARKVVTRTRNACGLDAPRNSLELPVETSYGLCMRDNILYALTKESSSKELYDTEAPMKKLISQEISKRPNTKKNGPSVVARLMGVDMLPFDSKPAPAPHLLDTKSDISKGKLMDQEQSKNRYVHPALSTSKSFNQQEFSSFNHHIDGYSDHHVNSNKPKSREHPQEEELQKFKKDFEAFQAARFKECSNVIEFSSVPTQLIAQEELNREKMILYNNARRTTNSDRLKEPRDLENLEGLCETINFGSCRGKPLSFSAQGKESLYSNKISRTEFRASHEINSNEKQDDVSAPTKIVILRPGPDRIDPNEDSWNSTPSTSEDRGSIEDFLEEVKERLKSELQGKSSKRSITVRGGGIESPYREKPSEPREIAQLIAQQVRESVTRDFGMNLLRSESTRSSRSEIQSNGTGSPEFINRDTRKLLAERLRNVMRGETHPEFPRVLRSKSSLSMSDNDKGRASQSRDIWLENNNFTNEFEKKSRSFRGEPDDDAMCHTGESPRSLVRSLSAPVSGSSFGKLLLEDRHVLTGAQIRRKHEVIEKVPLDIKKHKKVKFSIREKVSSFRYSLTLRGRLFRRRVKAVQESDQNHHSPSKDITSGPSVALSFYETLENSTEVPPSPASVCSSIHEEFWRAADYLSPISSSGVHQLEESEMPHVFREINSNLNELRKKLNQLEGAVPEESIRDCQSPEAEVEIEDQDEAYIRDLLIAAGLYDGSYNQSLSKWDPLGKPISNQVFEEVEEANGESAKDEEEISKSDEGEKVSHRVILDLLNEALPAILRQPVSKSWYMRKAIRPVHKPPHGMKLLSLVWNAVRVCIHSPADRYNYTLDNMLALDLKSNPWSNLVDDEIIALGREIECQIIEDLIEETIKVM